MNGRCWQLSQQHAFEFSRSWVGPGRLQCILKSHAGPSGIYASAGLPPVTSSHAKIARPGNNERDAKIRMKGGELSWHEKL
jgi:hypothetical protein